MIQRIQTVWLLLVVGFQAFFFTNAPADVWDVYPVNRFQVLSGLMIVLALAAIFLFKKRKVQIQFCNAVVSIGVAAAILLVSMSLWTVITLLLTAITVIVAYLAVRAIRKDEKLVRSYDRLR